MMQHTVLHITEDCVIYPYNRLSTLHHLHASFEILMPKRGAVHVRLDDGERIVNPGEILVLFPGIPHSYAKSEGCSGTIFMFSNKMLFSPEEDWSEMQPVQPVVRLDAVDRDAAHCLERLACMSASHEISESVVRAYLSLVFVWILPVLRPEKPAQPIPKDLLYTVMQFMSQNLAQPLSLRATAHALGVNTSYLSHLLNEKLHMGFREYLNALRIDRARRYLRVTSWSIEEIAAACGFTNLRTFDRVFQDRCSCTPRDFRKSYAALRSEQISDNG